MTLAAISMLSADFLHLEEDVRFVNRHADIFHLDIMDGVFVPNISYGFPVVESMAEIAEKPMDAHLMIVHPEKYVERFAKAGAAMLSFHLDAAGNPAEVLSLIRSCGMKAGIAINPDIPVERLYPFLDKADFVLVMSVFAGFGGQKFIPESIGRVRTVKDEILRKGCPCQIEVDGGVSAVNAAELREAGADILVSGSAVFRAADPVQVISALRG